MRIEISPWRNAPTQTDGKIVFAVGDVHGYVDQLTELLAEIARKTASSDTSELVFLGDLINRGPDSLGALVEWANEKHDLVHGAVHRLFGNHEQLMMIVAHRLRGWQRAEAKFLEIGGDAIIAELGLGSAADLSVETLPGRLDARVWKCLQSLQSHVCIGNLVFVHAGVDPAVAISESLKPDWTTYDERHWASIKDPFLQHQGGFGGRIIVHGHTPPWSHRASSGYPDPHTIQHDRLCLDGGTSKTGVVMGAQIEEGRYRLIACQL